MTTVTVKQVRSLHNDYTIDCDSCEHEAVLSGHLIGAREHAERHAALHGAVHGTDYTVVVEEDQ